MDRNPHLENAHKEATKNRERGKGKERNFEDEFYLEMDLAHRLLSCIAFLFSIFFCGMESEVMTVRDAQERAVGSSVRECRCIRSGPGIRMLMENGKKSVLSCFKGSDLTTVFLNTKCEEKVELRDNMRNSAEKFWYR
jgi:hypothetical protein